MIFYLGYVLLLVLYLLYVQFSPGMGNIWYRNDEYFSPMGAINMIFAPFYVSHLWLPEFWDINFVIWSFLYVSICFCYNLYYYK